MKLSDFLEKNFINSTKANDLVSGFIKELQNHLEKLFPENLPISNYLNRNRLT